VAPKHRIFRTVLKSCEIKSRLKKLKMENKGRLGS
jgi:hypothetical protein